MAFNNLLLAAEKYFPSLQIKYKNHSPFMKLIGILLFFNRRFMTDYTTTVGSTIYIPTDHYIRLRPVSGVVVLLHELTHMHDERKYGHLWFQLSYIFPQILVLPALLLFLIGWKIALPVVLLSLTPIPAYFRMVYEKRAYLSSLYVIQKLSEKLLFVPHFESQKADFIKCFMDSSYYFMWPFKSHLNREFDAALEKIQAGQRPYQDGLFDMLDDLISRM